MEDSRTALQNSHGHAKEFLTLGSRPHKVSPTLL